MQFPAFIIYMIAATAEVNRTPFDLPESETELVAGFHTEYSSMKFALLQMAEYINMMTVCALASTMFLGGWLSPLPGIVPNSPLWFFAKMMFLLFVFIWLRATVPRFRYDQLMDFGWKILIPIALGWFLLLAALREFSPDGQFGDSLRVVLISFAVAAVAVTLFGAALKVAARNRVAVLDAEDGPRHTPTRNSSTRESEKGASV